MAAGQRQGVARAAGATTTAAAAGAPSVARELRGAPVAAAICERLAPRVEALEAAGACPKLAIVRVGEGAGDMAYERGACSRMAKVGVACEVRALPADVAQAELERTLRSLADDASVHGILMLRPLPAHLDEAAAIACVPSAKDVDGMTALSQARVYGGEGTGFAPCTAEAVVALLEHYEVPLAGARVVVLGRSLVVGRPLALLLMERNATVTVCHSRTQDLAQECRRAQVLVSCMGRAGAVEAHMVAPGAVVIDVGTNDNGAGGICGDVAYEVASHIASAITPVPRGVGSVTTSVLAAHVVTAAEAARLA